MLPDSVRELLPFAGAAEDVALVMDGQSLTYAGLAAAVSQEADRLGPHRSLRVLEMRNDVDSVIALLGSLAARHPVVVVEAGQRARTADIEAAYADALDLHPDLALLLSTSGSTGSPKLVRLSHDNVWANARSIADYLGLTNEDRAVTSLPLHYCYGLSVLTSHLVAGATVVLTDASVAGERFWSVARSAGATSFAGVPYTFELLECRGFTGSELPTLRYLTQAGGRMDPARVRRFAGLGREQGFELFVMYGQTEATARMAYLPPHLAQDRPEAIGVPVPGGDFRLAPVPGVPDGTGELVYTGPNVMMGYAHSAVDLARGAETVALHTGDLARQSDDGLWEICGRLDRHAKVLGLRLDLARLEARIPVPTALVVVEDVMHGFVTVTRATGGVHRELCAWSGLPPHLVRVHQLDRIPTNSRGKTDFGLLAAHATATATAAAATATATATATGAATAVRGDRPARDGASAEALRDLFAVVLGRPDADLDRSFADLGGDSLSFVEVSTQLAHRLGHLPVDWPRLSPRQLAATARRRSRHLLATEPAVLLRALAILAIVVSHTDLFVLMGGAHVLLAVVGFNLARFSLHTVGRTERTRRLLHSAAGIAVPAALWVGATATVTGDYRPTTALFLNQAVGGPTWTADWQFWFLEVVVWSTLGLAALVLLPVVERGLRQRPFAVAMGVLACALAARYVSVGLAAGGTDKYTLFGTLWCIVLGWAAAEARNRAHRCLAAAAIVLSTWGFFPDDALRTALVVLGMMMLLVPWSIQLPRLLSRSLQLVAGASLWIYLTHWQVYPGLEAAGHPVVAVLASLAVGLAAHRVHCWILEHLARRTPPRESVSAPHATPSPRDLAIDHLPWSSDMGSARRA